jgi:hypothetical protein
MFWNNEFAKRDQNQAPSGSRPTLTGLVTLASVERQLDGVSDFGRRREVEAIIGEPSLMGQDPPYGAGSRRKIQAASFPNRSSVAKPSSF